jgi:hypothetical protein
VTRLFGDKRRNLARGWLATRGAESLSMPIAEGCGGPGFNSIRRHIERCVLHVQVFMQPSE